MLLKKKGGLSVSLKNRILAAVLVISMVFVGFMVLRSFSPVSNASAVLASSSIGVYWDWAATRLVTSINWGNVTPGSEKQVTVYAKNLGTEALILSMSTSTWNPSYASLSIFLCWDYNGKQIEAGKVVKIVLKLIVSNTIKDVNVFSFNINIGVGLEKSLDINGDGIVNIVDATFLAKAWLSRAGSPTYDYRCDFNNDGIINITDLTIFTSGWQQTSH